MGDTHIHIVALLSLTPRISYFLLRMKKTCRPTSYSRCFTRSAGLCLRRALPHMHIPPVCAQRVLPQPVTYRSNVNMAYSIRFWRKWFRKEAREATFWTVSGDTLSSPSVISLHLVMILHKLGSAHRWCMNSFVITRFVIKRHQWQSHS